MPSMPQKPLFTLKHFQNLPCPVCPLCPAPINHYQTLSENTLPYLPYLPSAGLCKLHHLRSIYHQTLPPNPSLLTLPPHPNPPPKPHHRTAKATPSSLFRDTRSPHTYASTVGHRRPLLPPCPRALSAYTFAPFAVANMGVYHFRISFYLRISFLFSFISFSYRF